MIIGGVQTYCGVPNYFEHPPLTYKFDCPLEVER
ncbi:hypothetical protein GALL_184990 [mine drainage metagenome]|uniref:Uncharacterized protein n=1 Tax=mine drainage metagenome TaxID=410659 RepID=A0A1J5RUP6_9ZZZZ